MQQSILKCLFFITTLQFFGCSTNTVFEKNIKLAEGTWKYENIPVFEPEISDTVSRYNLYLNLRHSNDYAFSNMWVKVHTTLPSGKKMESRVELPLADKSGKWFGKDSGSIINQQVSIQSNAIMPELGKYKFELEQNMRVDALTEVISVGLTIEKTQ
ncbi:MAG: gliding motility lipoprotein GldH [Sphingobacteriales bacterium]|nr:MAG: gliding motility lipoprotein GldH [Sphingobacteriales bacterium]